VLRALEEGVVTRVGGSKSIEVDVRVIAATNKDLARAIQAGAFREDLFYRLNVVPIHVPPLRERREDIAMLVKHFAEMMAKRDGVPHRSFDAAAVNRLLDRAWPGNVRELRNTVERLLILSPGDGVRAEDVDALAPGQGQGHAASGALLAADTFADFKERAERAYIAQKLRENDWNVAETARRIDMPRSNLYKKIEKYGLARDT
jgi:two-component system nitrogen regulation response regulator NtrX